MIINFFLQSKDFGGAEKFAADLVTEIAKSKQKINLYTTNNFLLGKLEKNPYLETQKISYYLDFAGNRKGLLKSILLWPFAEIYYLDLLLRIKLKQKQPLIICSGFSEKIIVAPLAKMLNIPTFFIEYGPLQPIFDKLYGIPRLLYLFSKNFAQKIIVPSCNTKQALSKIFDQEKLVFIPCGSSISINNDRQKVEKHTLVVVSRLEKGKGQDLAIKAFKMVQKKVKDAKLLIIGQGAFKEELLKLSQNNPQIKFLDYVENKNKILAESEIILCPSVWPLEGFGLTIIEAMALNKAIVAFDRSPGNEMLENEQNALLAKDGNVEDLAKKILILFANKKLQTKLALKARKDFLEKYQIQNIAKKYLNLLQN